MKWLPSQPNSGLASGSLSRGDFPSPKAAPELERSELIELVATIRRSRLVLFVAAVAGLCVGLLVARMRTPMYQAQTLIEIQGINENYLNMQSVDPLASDQSLAPSYLETQLRILQSRTLLRGVVDRLNLASQPTQDAHLFSLREALDRVRRKEIRPNTPIRPPERKADNLEQRQKAALEWLAGAISAKTIPQTRIIQISATTADSDLSVRIANTAANEYIIRSLDSRWEGIKQTSDWIAPKLDELRSKLEASEKALQAYAESSGVMFTSEGENSIAETKLLQLEEELSKAEAERVTKQTEFELASSTQPEFFPKAAEDATSKEFEIKLTDLRRQLADLRETFTPSHYKVQEVQAEIKELQAALAAEHATLAKRIENAFIASRNREELLKQQYESQAKLVSEQAAKIVRYSVLKHEVKSNQDIYEQLLRQLKEAGVASAMHANNIRVLDAAEKETRPVSPDMKWHSAIGLISGLFTGIAFIFAKQHADRTVRGPGQIARYIGISELGCIPNIDAKRQVSPIGRNRGGAQGRRLRTRGSTLSLGLNIPKTGHRADIPTALISWYDKSSLPAECFRAVVASLRLSTDNGIAPKAIVVTSAGPSEGKTTAVANLGIALAEIERSVLLIDADVHRPRLHRIFGLSNQFGLTTLLNETRAVDEYKEAELCRSTSIPGLSVLPSGPILPLDKVNNLLHSERLGQLLEALKSKFGTVLIDTPPAMGVSYARVLARLADGAILVIRAERTTIETALAAYQRLSEDRIQIRGTLLNGVSLESPKDYAYYGRYPYQQ